jgi:predicted metal-binding membrane protein
MMDRNLGTTLPQERAGLVSERVFLATSALLFAVSAAGTVVWSNSMSSGMSMAGSSSSSMLWTRVPGQSWLNVAAGFMGMWMVMMAAMMLPSLSYMLLSYRRALRRSGQASLGRMTILVGAGYFFVWAIFGLVAYPLGVSISAAEMQWMELGKLAPIATGVVLLLAGGLQLTAWKVGQLEHCLDRPASVMTPGARNAWRHGLQLGLHCSLCCLGFIMVLLATGVMDLGIMAAVTVAITAERLAPNPKYISRGLGVLALVIGFVVIFLGLI